MEIKINREIRNYTETMFFGLSMRQFFFSLAGVGTAIALYFLLRPYASTEILSWVCMLGAAPFMVMGFITYNGMTAGQFLIQWVKSRFIEPKKVRFECSTVYREGGKDLD